MRMRPRPGSAVTRTGDSSASLRVTVVESEACHFCADAQQVLQEASACYALQVRTVDVRSDEGQALMQAHRATMSPLVLLDGEFFSNGRLPRRKLAKVLAQRFPGSRLTDQFIRREGARHG